MNPLDFNNILNPINPLSPLNPINQPKNEIILTTKQSIFVCIFCVLLIIMTLFIIYKMIRML